MISPVAKQNIIDSKLEEICATANAHYAQNQMADAIDLYHEAQRLGPLKVDQLIFLMRAEYRLGKFADALQTIQLVLTDRPGQAEALKTGGRIANNSQKPALARQFWMALSESNPADPDGLLQMARLGYRGNAYEDAVSWARRLVAIEPMHQEGLEICVVSALRAGLLTGIDDPFVRWFEVDRAKAVTFLRQFSQMKAPENYAQVLRAIRDRFPQNEQIAALVTEAREQFMINGLQAEVQARDLDAARHYRAVWMLDPDSAEVKKGLERLRRDAVVKMRDGFRSRRNDQAIEFGRKAVEIDPRFFEAWMTLGRTHLLVNDYTTARDCFRTCTELCDQDSWAWLNYARTLDRTDDWKSAHEAYRRVIELATAAEFDYVEECKRAMRSLPGKVLLAGRQAANDGDMEMAWRLSLLAGEIGPDDARVVALKKYLLNDMLKSIRELWQNGSPDVIELCRRYLQGAPDDPYALQVLGRTLMNVRRFVDARCVWERLAELKPEDAHFRLQIARCCNWLKLRDEGIASARHALRLDATLVEAENIANQLAAIPPQISSP
jgi:tetratricopeptide (TPR) repeat protein